MMNDHLQRLLPRYIRINGLSFEDCDEVVIGSHVSSLKRLLGQDAVYHVKWVPGFVAVPGYVGLTALNNHPNYFPMDISSGYVVFQSGIGSADSSESALSSSISGSHCAGRASTPARSVLDLCCCPGGKYMAIADQLVGAGRSGRLLVGVDVSEVRMQTCKALLSKNMGHLYRGGPCPSEQGGIQDNATGRPRLLLFRADGTSFDRNNPGELVFDSAVHFSDDMAISTAPAASSDLIGDADVPAGRKRKNKSYRGRERQRLRASTEALLNASGHISCLSHSGPTFDDDAAISAASSEEGDVGASSVQDDLYTPNAFSGFDVVFVDAECSHDGSYRHLAALEAVDPVRPSAAEGIPQSETEGGSNRNESGGEGVIEGICVTMDGGADGSDRSSGRSQNPSRLYVKKDRYSTRDESSIVDLQKRLISHGFELLRPGGVLMYSTCSLSPRQNHGVVRHLLMNHLDAQLVPITERVNDRDIVDSSRAIDGPDIESFESESDLSYSGASLFDALSLSERKLTLFLSRLCSNEDAMKRAAEKLCEHIASMSQAPRNCFQGAGGSRGASNTSGISEAAEVLADEDLCAPLPGTVQFQRSCGTSGLFVAKIMKK